MSKFFRVVGIAVVMVGIVLAFSACGGGDDVTGKWQDTMGITYEFKADGTVLVGIEGMGEMAGTYEVSGGNISIDIEGEKADAPYKIDGDTMTISPVDEEEVVLTRQ